MSLEAGVDAVKLQLRDLDSVYDKKVLDNKKFRDVGLDYLIPHMQKTQIEKKHYLRGMKMIFGL